MPQAESYYFYWGEASCRNIMGLGQGVGRRFVPEYCWAPMMNEKSVHIATLWRQVAPPAFIDDWAPMNGKVGATCRPPTASCTFGIYRLLYQPKGHEMLLKDTE